MSQNLFTNYLWRLQSFFGGFVFFSGGFNPSLVASSPSPTASILLQWLHLLLGALPHTSAKRRKGYALFSAALVLPAFVKNAVAFLKLF